MPELPEVETTRRGIAPHIEGNRCKQVVIRQASLRWPIPMELTSLLPGQQLQRVRRRAKYLLLDFDSGKLLLHLGMSGSLRVLSGQPPAKKHDHFDIEFDNGVILRLRDPRRFGAVLWCNAGEKHPLLAQLGREPLEEGFTGSHLKQAANSRHCPVKSFIMDNHVVVGVGNIYANESLFRAGIHPTRPANRISAARYDKLAAIIKEVLSAAIAKGGTTLRDFQQEDGSPGYFAQSLLVYGKAGEPCPTCGAPIRTRTIGQRASYYCIHCQS